MIKKKKQSQALKASTLFHFTRKMHAAEQNGSKMNVGHYSGQQFRNAFLSFTLFQKCFTHQEKGGKRTDGLSYKSF